MQRLQDGRHLSPVLLGHGVENTLRVQAPPALVALVNALTPMDNSTSLTARSATQLASVADVGRQGAHRSELEVHLTHPVTFLATVTE